MEIIIFAALFSGGIALWAKAWGRNPLGWFALSFILSPLISAIALLVVGKTIEKRAEEQQKINSHT